MYATSVFLYTQRQIVVLVTGNSVRKYMPVYAKPLTLHKGVDNQIQFQFINQEQKPVDITGKEITCRIISYQGTKILLQKALTLQLPVTGIASLFVSPVDLEDIDAQKCYYSLEIPTGQFDFPVFVDQNAGARGDLNIVNSVLPSFVPSYQVTIPSGQPFPNLANANTLGNIANANSVFYYSSTISTDGNPIVTFQAKFKDYYGNVAFLGSCIPDGDWYPIDLPTNYANTSDTYGYTLRGYHPYIRMEFYSNSGEVTDILVR